MCKQLTETDVPRVIMESARGPSRRYEDYRGGAYGGYRGGGRRPTRLVAKAQTRPGQETHQVRFR